MRRKWIGWFAVLAAAAFLIPLMPWFGSSNQPNRTSENPTPFKPMSAKQEHNFKMATVKQDMDATAMLCTTECSKNLHKLMLEAKSKPSAAMQRKLAHLMRMHKQIIYVSWNHNGRVIANGKKPQGSSTSARLMEAKKKLQRGQDYASAPFNVNGDGIWLSLSRKSSCWRRHGRRSASRYSDACQKSSAAQFTPGSLPAGRKV